MTTGQITTDEMLRWLAQHQFSSFAPVIAAKLKAADELAEAVNECSGDKDWGKGAEPKIYEAWSNYVNAGESE